MRPAGLLVQQVCQAINSMDAASARLKTKACAPWVIVTSHFYMAHWHSTLYYSRTVGPKRILWDFTSHARIRGFRSIRCVECIGMHTALGSFGRIKRLGLGGPMYENLNSTRVLATHCAVCARPLRDAMSVELGIGPDCRAKYGYDDAINDANRSEANRLIYLIADRRDGLDVIRACATLRALGFVKLANKIADRLADLRITLQGDRYALVAPYSEEIVGALRAIPGRRWDKVAKVNTFPLSSKGALWATLKRLFSGKALIGPEGQAIQIP